MADEPYDVGDRAVVTCDFRDPTTARPGYAGDPLTLAAGDTIVATVRDPAGNETQPAVTRSTFTITHPTTGAQLTGTRATVQASITRHGEWFVRFASTGSVQAAEETILPVRRPWTKRY